MSNPRRPRHLEQHRRRQTPTTAEQLTSGMKQLAGGEYDDPKDRPEAGHLNYPGDVAAAVMAEPIMGPTTAGLQVIAVHAAYDPIRDRTRVAFAHATPADVERELARTLLGGADDGD